MATQRESNPALLNKTVEDLKRLWGVNSKDPTCGAYLVRFLFYRAINTPDSEKKSRITKYQDAIDLGEAVLKLDPNNLMARFWLAAALGKQGLDIGIGRSLRQAKFIKQHLEVVEKAEPAYESAGALRALGIMYYELPGWPFSFGSYSKSVEYLKRAHQLSPTHLGNKSYLARSLIKSGEKELARTLAEEVLSSRPDPNHPNEENEYREIARFTLKKLD
ncbi:MAG: hypothetical protein IT289_03615 [Oligoflexia bacterium]|nr:hypothetical protein [Oligoflexia bacterium]